MQSRICIGLVLTDAYRYSAPKHIVCLYRVSLNRYIQIFCSEVYSLLSNLTITIIITTYCIYSYNNLYLQLKKLIINSIKRYNKQYSKLLVLQRIIIYKEQRLQNILQFLSQSQLNLAYQNQTNNFSNYLSNTISICRLQIYCCCIAQYFYSIITCLLVFTNFLIY